MKISIEELIETADALIAPVRMGCVRPTAPFAIITGNQNDNSEDLFSVEPFAPTSSSGSTTRQSGSTRSANEASGSGTMSGGNNNGASSILRVVPDETAASFLSRHDIGFRLRNMEADTDDGALDNGQDEEDASEQDDPMPTDHQQRGVDRDRPLLNHQRSNIDDEEIESDMDFNFHEAETESDSDDNLSTQDAQRSVQTGATHGSDTGDEFNLTIYIYI